MTTIQQLFELQAKNKEILKKSTAKQRLKRLKLLEDLVLEYRPRLKDALYQDLRKNEVESDITEISSVLTEIRFIRKRLRYWMQEKRIPTPAILFGTSSRLRYEPKGTTLIISPWNYPVNLSLLPLAGAVAAGNTVVIKPSEHSPTVSAVIREMIEKKFPQSEIAVVEGDASVATELLDHPFDHIFFTGSSRVGKIVMTKAASNLSSVTLELGGKCPVIIDKKVNLDKAVQRIVWAKLLNSGQTCIAPDYLLVHESRKEALITRLKQEFDGYSEAMKNNETDFSCLVNEKQFQKLSLELDRSVSNGAKVHRFGQSDATVLRFAPALLSDVAPDDYFATEEIFGPVLPVFTWTDPDELIGRINSKPKALAIYIFSNSGQTIRRIKEETSSGALVVNHNIIHFSNLNLPFGGINSSGIGKYHGKYSFECFSNQKAIVKQWSFLSASSIFRVPYSKSAKSFADFMVRKM